MFIGRKYELGRLNELWDNGKFECVVMYGRRRVGKTTLINEFIKDKNAIFFTAMETSAGENLENLSKSIMQLRLAGDASTPRFNSYQDAIDSVCDVAGEHRLVMVIDEYPYLADSYQGISSILQVAIDHKLKNSKLMLILCGSSMSFMENQVLGHKSPLYGRRTAQFKIKPFSFFESFETFSGDLAGHGDPVDSAVIYGITGGVPFYLNFIDGKLSVEENIKRCFFQPSAFLNEEPANLLKQEVREPALYNAVIKAIATGSSRISTIATKTDIETSACSEYLKNLIALGIVKKEFPFREETSRKTIYMIEDGMFRFWYRFVPDNVSLIQNNLPDRVWKRVAPQIPAFMGGVFEDICKQWLWRENVEERVFFSDLGRWWGNDPIHKRETEIDIVAHADEDSAIFGECKWTNEKIDTGVLDSLMERSELFRYKSKSFYVFSKSGFTSGCEQKAEALGNIRLVTLLDIISN